MARPSRTTAQQAMLDEIGHNIREARLRAEMSQDDLADRLGVNDRRYISMVEQGRQSIAATRLIEIAAALGVTPGSLLDAVAVELPQLDG